jgi:hypothetical protein
VGYCQSSLRDYAARILLWEKRNPGLPSLDLRSGVW